MSKRKNTKKATPKVETKKTESQADTIKKLQVENAAILKALKAKDAETPVVPVPEMPKQPVIAKPESMKDKPSVTDIQPAMTKEAFQRVITAYKKQNPRKYAMKKVALEKKLATLPSERKK